MLLLWSALVHPDSVCLSVGLEVFLVTAGRVLYVFRHSTLADPGGYSSSATCGLKYLIHEFPTLVNSLCHHSTSSRPSLPHGKTPRPIFLHRLGLSALRTHSSTELYTLASVGVRLPIRPP